jgi:MFS family permease
MSTAASPAVALPRPASGNAVRRILTANAVSVLGDGVLLPFAAIYFVGVCGFSAAAAGLVIAAMMGSGVVLTAPAGALLDRLGARNAAIGATLAQAAGCVALGFATTLPAALAAGALYGAGRAVARPGLDALIGALSDAAQRTSAFAALNLATNIGFGAGAALGGLLAGIDGEALRWLFVVDAASFAVFAIALAGAPETPVDRRDSGGYRTVLRDRAFVMVAALGLVVFLGLTQLDVGFALFSVSVVHVSLAVVGIAGLANTVAVVALQTPMIRWTQTVRRTRCVAAGVAGLAACWALLAAAAVVPGAMLPAIALVAALTLMGAAETVLLPIIFALVNDLAPDELRGRYNAAIWTVGSSAFAVSPLLGGALIGAHLAALWLVLLVACAAAGVALARMLERTLAPALNAA